MKQEELANLHLDTTYRDIDLNKECGELCEYFMSSIKETQGLQGSRGTKSVYLTPIEEDFIYSFCEANNTNISDLVRLSFWTDGAIPEALIIALHNTPRSVLTFLDLGKSNLDFSYLEKWADYTKEDFEKAFDKTGKTKPIRDRSLIIEETEKHRKQKGFPSWAYYAKQGMLDLGVYPELAIDVAKSHLRVIDGDMKFTEAQLKAKKKRQEKAALAKTRGDKNPKAKNRSMKLALTAFKYEQDNIIQPFIDALRAEGLSLSTFAKYKLLEHGIIKDSMIRMDQATKDKCGSFSYERPTMSNNKLFYENELDHSKGTKRHINNVSVLVEVRDVLFEHEDIGRGGFASWIRKNVLDPMNVYPLAKDTNESVMEIFQSN